MPAGHQQLPKQWQQRLHETRAIGVIFRQIHAHRPAPARRVAAISALLDEEMGNGAREQLGGAGDDKMVGGVKRAAETPTLMR